MTRGVGIAVFGLAIVASLGSGATVYYVDAGSGGGNGLSWGAAFPTIQDAINAAMNGDEIWVKAGAYNGQTTMQMNENLYGGFAGDETLRSERDWVNNVTTITASSFPGSTNGTVQSHFAVIDGFTITGTADGVGVLSGEPTIVNCRIVGNTQRGVDCTESRGATLINCLVADNNIGIEANDAINIFLYDTTVAHNTTNDLKGGGTLPPRWKVYNSIVYPGVMPMVKQGTTDTYPDVQFSIVDFGSQTFLAAENPTALEIDPLFIDPTASDYRLRPDSQGINAGSDFGQSTEDIQGFTRGLEGQFDIGAYEYDPAGDLDGDNIPDAIEGGGDPDSDGKPNYVDEDSDGDNVDDVYEGVFDTDSDTTPDYLDLDRDNNGVDDGVDVFRVFVDKSNTKGSVQDGRSWETAFVEIAPGAELAIGGVAAGGGEVWIAGGTYNEQRTFIRQNQNTGSLRIENNIALYGGFAGTEDMLTERDLSAQQTIIDGSVARGGLAATAVIDAGDDVTLDGLTIRGGRGTIFNLDLGAGVRAGNDLTINACLITDNIADYEAGGVRTNGGTLSVTNTIFANNTSNNAGALYVNSGMFAVIINCVFYDNHLTNPPDVEGSAIHVRPSAMVTVRNAIFRNNDAAEITVATFGTLSAFNSIFEAGSPFVGGTNAAGDPEFLDPASLDFRITVESIAHDTGSATSLPAEDIIGQQRPRGNGPDIGAYEAGDKQDLDSDGIPDYVEGAGDPDTDSIPNYLDDDSDGDTIPDATEGEGNPDGDGVPNYLDLDSDNDGIPDQTEGAGDPDGDGLPNYLDDDSDDDGLSDTDEEFNLPTDRLDSDSDDDGLLDGPEVNTHNTNPIVADSDGDNLSDGDEVNIHGTNPNLADTDDDNLNDDVEINIHGTNPNLADTDGDDLNDFDEINVHGTNPLVADSDGDNLSDGDEINVHETNPNLADTDDDDMPDDFEVNNGLDPKVDDASEDPDMDNFDNLNEFNRGSDPQDGNSPYRNLYVSNTGNDTLGDGSEQNPWATIAMAMSEAALDAAEDNFVTIHLAEGLYEELVEFVPFVGILGAGPNSVIRHFEPSDDIHNVVIAADDTAIGGVTVDIPIGVGDDTTLIRIDNANMIVDSVVLNGRSNLDSTGVLVARSGSSDSTITNCTFRNLENGVHAVNSGVRIARNSFEFINQGNAIFIGFAQGAKGEEPLVAPGLGDGLDVAQTGFNRFRNIDGFFINIDEVVPITTFAEYNDWGTDDAEEIAAKISLPQVKGAAPDVDFEPFLKTRLAPSSVIVPLFVEGAIDTDGKPVPVPEMANPTVSLSPGIGAGTRDSGTGAFLFPNVPSGSYTADGTANGHDSNNVAVTALDGASVVATLTLVNKGAGTGPEDINEDGELNAVDVQLVINGVLQGGATSGDVNNDGTANAVDVQLVINAVLGV